MKRLLQRAGIRVILHIMAGSLGRFRESRGHHEVIPSMNARFISRGFTGRRSAAADPSRLPPGQHVVPDFPVLSAGPTPPTPQEKWDFAVDGHVASPQRWTWEEFYNLPRESITVDIHCVTKWSKLDTRWEGISVDTLLGTRGNPPPVPPLPP